MTAAPTLRTRRREETMASIRSAAARQLAEQGAAALSLRAVARDLSMAVSALYRYYPSRDDLLTELLIDAFDAQADAVEAGASLGRRRGGVSGDRMRGAWDAYRAWSLDHPAEFGLAYGSPVPGYSAPPERTIRAGARVGDVIMAILADGASDGTLDLAVAPTPSAATRRSLTALAARRGYELPANVLAAAVDSFVRLHGFVAMETFGQLRPLTTDPDRWWAETLVTELAGIGAAPSRGRTGR